MYRKLILITTCLTFCVIVLGAYVRLSDAGLGCPDWPGCYGEVTPARAGDDIAAAAAIQPNGPVTLPKAWKEMIHRYVASTLGIFIIAIALVGWLKRAELRQSPTLPVALIGLVIIQGLLGMWTVTRLLKPVIVTSHLIGGLTILALLTWLALRQFRLPGDAGIIALRLTRVLAAAGFAALAVQIALGGWVSTNYAAMACRDFPLCQDALVPSMDIRNAFHVVRELGMTANGELLGLPALTAIHWMHRLGALATTFALGWLALRLVADSGTRWLGKLLSVALVIQVLLGIGSVVLSFPLALAVMHNAGAALLVVTLVIVNFALRRSVAGGLLLAEQRSSTVAA